MKIQIDNKLQEEILSLRKRFLSNSPFAYMERRQEKAREIINKLGKIIEDANKNATMTKKSKKYCFDFIREECLKWPRFAKSRLTKQMILNTPLRTRLPLYIPNEEYLPLRDYYGVEIDDIKEYLKQRDEYIDLLYIELKNEWYNA